MKKLFISLFMVLFSLTIFPVQSIGANSKEITTSSAPKPAENAEAKALLGRLDEIRAMDKSKLTSSEKKDLRKEVKSIRTRLSDVSGGVYISGAAVIIIVVLLLILL